MIGEHVSNSLQLVKALTAVLHTVTFLDQLQVTGIPILLLWRVGHAVHNIWKDTGVWKIILGHLDACPFLLHLRCALRVEPKPYHL